MTATVSASLTVRWFEGNRLCISVGWVGRAAHRNLGSSLQWYYRF